MAHVLQHNVAVQLVRIALLVAAATMLVCPFDGQDCFAAAVALFGLVVSLVMKLLKILGSCILIHLNGSFVVWFFLVGLEARSRYGACMIVARVMP